MKFEGSKVWFNVLTNFFACLGVLNDRIWVFHRLSILGISGRRVQMGDDDDGKHPVSFFQHR